MKVHLLDRSNALAARISFEERMAYLNDKGNEITKSLKADELEKFLGTMLQGASKQGEKEKLVHLKKALTELGYTGDILRQVDGHLLLTLNSAVSTFIPRLNSVGLKPGGKTNKPWTQSEKFKELVSSGEFSGLQTEDCIKLKSFIIDVYEEDIIPTDEMIVDLFSSIDLA